MARNWIRRAAYWWPMIIIGIVIAIAAIINGIIQIVRALSAQKSAADFGDYGSGPGQYSTGPDQYNTGPDQYGSRPDQYGWAPGQGEEPYTWQQKDDQNGYGASQGGQESQYRYQTAPDQNRRSTYNQSSFRTSWGSGSFFRRNDGQPSVARGIWLIGLGVAVAVMWILPRVLMHNNY